MSERVCVVCVRTDDVLEGGVVTGSLEVTCDVCGAPVMVSPSGLDFIVTHGATAVCVVCGGADITPETKLCAVPGAMAALEADLDVIQMERVRFLMQLLGIEPMG